MAKPSKGLTDQELKSLIDQEAYSALGYIGKLTEQRRSALQYYEGRATGRLSPPEVEGRSSVVSPDVANAVEWAMPSLMRIFASGEKIVQFEPRKPGQEAAAEMATDYINWQFWTQNEGFRITYDWIKDALLSKNGFVKVWSEECKEVTQEDYTGLTENQYASLIADDDVEVIEHEESPDPDDEKAREQAAEQAQKLIAEGNPQGEQILAQMAATPPVMLHAISIKRTEKKSRLRVMNVPPEEMLVSRWAKSIDTAPFIAHRVQRTLGSLIADGYDEDKVMSLADDNNWAMWSQEAQERKVFDDEWLMGQMNDGPTTDPLMRKVWLIDCYIQCDYDGDGIVETRRVLKAGFEILENEMVDGNPFADMCPILMPHRFFGRSLADVTMDFMEVKTALLRQLLDALYLGNNPRYEAVESNTNMEDLLTARPGGVVRVKAPNSVNVLQTADISGQAINGLEYVEKLIEERTGITKYNQGMDSNTLNQTATGVNLIQQAAMQKLELMARVFAEVGFKRLFKLMLKEVTRFQDKRQMARLEGKWVEIDPREWQTGFDLSISVGLGTGNREAQAAQIKGLLAVQGPLVQMGIVTPKNVYEAAKLLPTALGYKSPELFFTDPQNRPQQQHNPAQSQMQIEQMKAQLKAQTDTQSKQGELQLERERMAMQAEVDRNRQQVEAQQQQAKMMMEKELEQFKVQAQMELEQMKAQLQQDTALKIAHMNNEAKLIAAQLQAQTTATPQQDMAADMALNDQDDK